jgi:hypothetical protein
MGKSGGLPLKTGFLAFWGLFLIDLKSVALKNRVFYRAGSKIGFVQRSHIIGMKRCCNQLSVQRLSLGYIYYLLVKPCNA